MEDVANLIVVSPHLDDGVFSCGEALATAVRSVVVTVFAGLPDRRSGLTQWDAACGFRDGDSVMAARRHEDERALNVLGATPIWLDFLDAQYGPRPSPEDIAPQLFAAISTAWKSDGANTICFPLGLFHSDHELVREASLRVMSECPGAEWYFYEDIPYRNVDDFRDRMQARMEERGIGMTPRSCPGDGNTYRRKRQAVMCYQSQLRGLKAATDAGLAGLMGEERYLRISAPLLEHHAIEETRNPVSR
jgi:LmbE family N-acetylglucosaminyl deacetylase